MDSMASLGPTDLATSCNSGRGQAQKETSVFFYLPTLHYAKDEENRFFSIITSELLLLS